MNMTRIRRRAARGRRIHLAQKRALKLEQLERRIVLAGSLVISEFLADNSRTLDDEDGDSSDYIEVHNPTSTTVSLEDWYLTDEADNLDKWAFPAIDIHPGEYLVVFASNKNRTDPAGNLHTNFQLDTDGEYLALTHDIPDPQNPGHLVTEIVHEYSDPYPQQITDVAYGIPTELATTTLVDHQSDVQLLVPSDDSLGLDWTQPEFQPDASWTSTSFSVGFETDPGAGQLVRVADSRNDWSTTGTQGANNWTYGYYNRTQDADNVYQAGDFMAFPANYWTGTIFDWPSGNPPWDEIGQEGAHPNGTNTGENHWVIRRWESEYGGSLEVTFHLRKTNLNCGNGTTGVVLHNGSVEFSRTVASNDGVGYTVPLTISGVQAGDYIDFALLPDGTDGSFNDGCDGSAFWATIDSVADLSDAVDNDISGLMHQVNSSAYLVIPFPSQNPIGFDSLGLRMQYDSGFTAFLNGVPVVGDNAPDAQSLAYNSQALSERGDGDASRFMEFDISGQLSLLREGMNVLAIQGLNSSANDTDFLISAELYAGTRSLDEASAKYFTLPTPGQPNGSGTDDLGPVIANQRHAPSTPLPTENTVVTAEVSRSFDEVADVTLHFRVMYGSIATVAMMDDGMGSDAVAGDGVYTAVIPSAVYSAGQMVRWYITAEDADGSTTRLPAFPDPLDSAEYFGTVVHDRSIQSNLPVLHWFAQNASAAANGSVSRGSMFFLDEFYDNIRTDIHGQSSQGFPKKALDVDFNKGHRFKWKEGEIRVKDINLLSNWADKAKVRNTLAYEVYEQSGTPYHFAFPVRIQQNGQFFSTADMVEDGDDRYLERLGLDPDGALYKVYNTLTTVGHATSGVEKKTRRYENNTDLTEFLTGALQTGGARTNFLYDNLNIPEAINYLTGFVLTANRDCCHKNFYVYRDTNGTREWQILPWDVDLSFGHNWRSGPAYFDDVIYWGEENNISTGSNNGVIRALYEVPALKEMFLRRLRTLMDEILQPPGTPASELKFEARLAELVQAIDPHNDPNPFQGMDDADLDYQKWGSWAGTGSGSQPATEQTMRQAVDRLLNLFFPNRRQYLYGSPSIYLGGQIPAPQPDLAALPADRRNLLITAVDFSPTSRIQDQEFIQINNNNPFPVDISNWRITEGVEHTFIPGTVIPSNGRLYVSPNVVEFRARRTGPRGGLGLFVQGNYEGHLSSLGETLRLLDNNGNEIHTFTYEGNPSPVQQYLKISEINYNPYPPSSQELAANPNLLGTDFEYIELINTSDEPLNLAGAHFTSGVTFSFEPSMLQPGERILVVNNAEAMALRYGDGLNIAGEFEAGNLSNGGELIKLEDGLNSTIVEFEYNDGGDWPAVADGRGASLVVVDLLGDYTDPANWRSSTRFNGSPAGEDPAPVADIVINEVLTHTDPPAKDSIELFNATTEPIDISGWYLSDSSGEYLKFQIPAGTMVPAGGYLVFDEDDFNSSLGTDPKDFALDGAHGDEVWLMASDGGENLTQFVDQVEFGAAANGESFGRWPNGSGALYPMLDLTLAAENSGPRVGPVIISEVLYHAPEEAGIDNDDLEFVEVHNPTGTTVDLTGWQISGGVDYQFADGQMLPPQGVIVVIPFDPDAPENADRITAVRDLYGLDEFVTLVGGYSGRLNNAGDRIRLLRPDEPPVDDPTFTPLLLEDEVIYDDQEPWPTSADGMGSTLNRAAVDQWGNDPASWTTDGPSPGFVGGRPPVVTSVVTNEAMIDPPDLATPQPTSWRSQRSDIRSLTITFNEAVQIAPADITLVNLGIDAPQEPDVEIVIDPAQMTIEPRQVTILFPHGFTAGGLPDGAYQVRIASTVMDLTGNALDGDRDGVAGGEYVLSGDVSNGLFKLTGNFNDDYGVSIFDFPTFAYWFGKPKGVAPDYVNLNDDGGVTLFDFPLFVNNFGTNLRFQTNAAPAFLPSRVDDTLSLVDDRSVDAQQQIPVVDETLPRWDAPLARGRTAQADRRDAGRDDHDPLDLEAAIELIARSEPWRDSK